MTSLILYFVFLPVIWVGVGGFSTGILEEMLYGGIPFMMKVFMIIFAPITLIVLLATLAYKFGQGVGN